MQNSTENPLGRATETPQQYSPESLFALPRAAARSSLGLAEALPFHGEDLWNAWELTWLDSTGRPTVGVAEMRVPADSPGLIESKSLKLYLNSMATTRYDSALQLRDTIAADLGACSGSTVAVVLHDIANRESVGIHELAGICIDNTAADFESMSVDSAVLRCDDENVTTEELYSDLLRSNCPVTGQPDTGSILIRYHGPKIDRGALLEYLVSFRHLDEFHEHCVERIFVDLKSRCAPDRLTVYARYNRRGGIDINPFRSDFEHRAENLRLARQ